MAWLSSSRHRARPSDHLCGLGYSPADARQSAAENEVCRHAERMLNMVHAYCEIRDSWIGWLRGDAMNRTLYERIVPEMRALRDDERRIVDTPSVTLLAVLDYAARAREAVPAYTPRKTIDYPQPPVPDAVRAACERMMADAEQAALTARQASARAYAARMTQAIERERTEEERRQRAMKEHGITETPEEAERAQEALAARIAVYQRELDRVSDTPSSSEAIGYEKATPSSSEAIGHEKATPSSSVAREGARTQAAPQPITAEAARAHDILAAMRAWAGPCLKWGRHRGAPYLRALRRATGLRDITRAERNRLWLSARLPARRRAPKAGAEGPDERRATP